MRSPLQVRQHVGCTGSSSQAQPRLLRPLPSCCQANKLSVSQRNSRVSSGTDPVKVSYTVRSVQVNKQALLYETAFIRGSAFGATAHCAFMALPRYTRNTRSREGEAEEWLQTLPGGPLSEELLSSLLQHARSSRDGS